MCAGAECAGDGGRADAGAGPRPHERPDAAGGDQVRHPRPPPAVRHGHSQHNHPQPDRNVDDSLVICVRPSLFPRLCWVVELHSALSCFGKMRNICRGKKRKVFCYSTWFH